MSALLFGSISTVADTSEMQRAAYNAAFAEHGLRWRWERDEYRSMLADSGGQNRIAEFARSRGEDVDAQAVHQTKSKIFQESVATETVALRPGVAETMKAAKDHGWRVALVTTTSRANIEALLAGHDEVAPSEFDVIVDSASVDEPKPDPAAYDFALHALGQEPGDCVAIEDNVGGVTSARAAGVQCVAFPNANTAGHDFGAAPVTDRLVFDQLAQLADG